MPYRLLVLALVTLGLVGCGNPVPIEDVPADGNVLSNQMRVAAVFSSTLNGYAPGDTLQIQIVGDRLAVMGGGGTIPVVNGLRLVATTTAGIYAGTRALPGSITETYTVTIDTDARVSNLDILRTGAGAGSCTAPVGASPTLGSSLVGTWTLAATAALQAQTSSGATSMVLESTGLLWWDLDGNAATTDDFVALVMKTETTNLIGSATILYDWNGDMVNDLVRLSVQLSVSGGTITRVLAHAAPVLSSVGTGIDWVDDATPTKLSSIVPTFGPWSASMAGHWLAIPTTGGTTISGLVPVTRVETERNAVGIVLSTSISSTGSEQETVTIGFATDVKSGYPVVKLTLRTVVDRVGSATDETTRYAVYLARGSDGVVYRIGNWEDVDDDNVIDAGEEFLYPTVPQVAFPATEPADDAAYAAALTRWGRASSATHFRNRTFATDSGLAAVSELFSTATTTPAPSGFVSVNGTGTIARLTAFWRPGTGITGMRWSGDSVVVRRFMRGDGTWMQVERISNGIADLGTP